MKKVLIVGVLIGTLLFAASANANTPETAIVTPHKPPPSMIDGIEIPYEVLEYAQLKYQGYAVTQASRTFHGGQAVYQLRVDRDDIPDDYDSIILLYDMKWKLIADERMVAPPQRYLHIDSRQEVRQQPEHPHITESQEEPTDRNPDDSTGEPAQPENPVEDEETYEELPRNQRNYRN